MPSPRLNVLVVSAQFPYPPRSGFAMRVHQLARRLAERHGVTLLSYARPHERAGVEALRGEMRVEVVEREAPSELATRAAQAASLVSARPYACRKVRSPALQQRIDELWARERFDLVQVESSLLCTFSFPRGVPLVVDEHNIESEVFARMRAGERSGPRRTFNRLEAARFGRFEQRWWGRAAACVVTSERDARTIRAHAPGTPVAVVPNGVDLVAFRPAAHAAEPRTVVFNGILDYRPNLDAAHHLVDDVWPRVLSRTPGARLTIVGRGHPRDIARLRRPGVAVTGEVADVRPYLHRAAVVAVPVRMGGGTRLKVVEGLAAARPMVSTTLGCEGVRVRAGEHLLVADGAEAFAAAVVRLFEDPALGYALGAAGRRLVEREYSWDLAAGRLDALLTEVALGQAPRTAREAVAA
jgi:sugar transferase (PEP-CTERM/EpsH1 system associated)